MSTGTTPPPFVRAGLLALLAAAPRPGAAQARPPEPPSLPNVPNAAAPNTNPPNPAAAASGAPCGGAPARVAPRVPAPARAGAPAPARGYLGLRLSEVSEVRWTDGGRLVRYCAYPLVVSVEPASPAERAGLGAGDTLVAYGARDLVRDGPVPLDRLLVPGETVRVRLRREGRTLTRAVVVGERPAVGVWALGPGAALPLGWPDRPFPAPNWRPRPPAPDSAGDGADRPVRVRVFAPGRVVVRAPAARDDGPSDVERLVLDAFGRDEFAGDVLARDVLEHARAGAAPWVTYLRALPPLPGLAWATAYGPAALAGAQLVALDDDLREAVAGAPPRGVFVLQVLPGTPAAEAGLRAGDVLTAAAGRPVETPAALQRALAGRAQANRAPAARRRADGESPAAPAAGPRAGGRAVALRVARGGAARDVVLRW